ncbi:MAG: hypothetical protein KA015_02990 [Spirochaetes bacterium]|nr:hypothetical protein [Spirochaetota bacterium]
MKKIAASFLLLLSCSSNNVDKNIKPKLEEISFSLKSVQQSEDAIEKSRSIQIFFELNNDIESLSFKIILTSRISLTKERNLMTFFVLDRGISASSLTGRKIIFTEIYRNFDKDWNILKNDKIEFNDRTGPFHRLSKGIYRIRLINTDTSSEKLTIQTDKLKLIRFFTDLQ